MRPSSSCPTRGFRSWCRVDTAADRKRGLGAAIRTQRAVRSQAAIAQAPIGRHESARRPTKRGGCEILMSIDPLTLVITLTLGLAIGMMVGWLASRPAQTRLQTEL